MRRWVALLRAMNVGGRSVVPMTKLRAAFESFGVREVSTYIQSGNVVFSSDETNATKLARALETHLARTLRLETTAFVFARADLENAAKNDPFVKLRATHHVHVMFLSDAPDAAHRRALQALERDDYLFAVKGRVLHYAYDKKLAGKRRALDFERVLGVRGTSRTWKVVEALIARA